MGNLLEIRDPRGNITTFAYDYAGRITSVTDALSRETSFEYDGANNRTAIINALMKRFDFVYDEHNNMIRATDPYQKYITTGYNTDDLPVSVTDQEGKVSSVEYDNEGRTIKSIDGAGNTITYSYDETLSTQASSYLPVQIDYPTYTSRLYYDNMQRVVRKTDILDDSTTESTSYVYDEIGNVIQSTDKQDETSGYEYDALNRLIKTTDPLGNITQRFYDDRGNLTQLIDPNNGSTRYEYNRNNLLTKVIRPMGEETVYEYDAMGNRTAVLDAKNQRIEYTVNEVSRITQVCYYAAGDHTTPVKTVDFTYNELGSLMNYDDGTTTGSYTYDDLQRKLTETIDYGSFSKTYGYSYYANGLKQSFTAPDESLVSYTYDAGNRLSSVNIPFTGQITYNTYDWNSPARITLPGGSATDYGYDPLMRIKTIQASDPAQNPVMTREYTYAPSGNITDKATEHGTYAYGYDELYRLTSADNPTIDDEAYTYDALGNRLTSAATTGNWGYNTNNQLTGYDAVSFTYDDAGNLTSKTAGTDETVYSYDIEDRLVRVEDGTGGVIAEYYYDPFGRRLWKDVAGTRTCFGYADEGLVAEYDAAGTQLRAYGYAPGSAWSTDPLYLNEADTYYWYQNDHLGTPQKITSTSGAVVWSATYDSFGNCQVGTQTVTNNLRLPGQYYDAETGLYYNWHRYYDPTTGRYLTTDPVEEGLNLYSYCFNNPVNLIDPEGLCAVNWARTKAHDILALAGMIPYLGVIPDLLDSLLYLAEGNFYQAAFALGCSIPVVGDAMRGLQFASKGLKFADKTGSLQFIKKVLKDNTGSIGKLGKASKKTDIKVIGRHYDTKVAEGWEGHDVLNIKDWTIPKNDKWVQQGIKNKQDFYTASPEKGNLWDAAANRETVYARELGQIKEAGYVKRGDTYIHPDNL